MNVCEDFYTSLPTVAKRVKSNVFALICFWQVVWKQRVYLLKNVWRIFFLVKWNSWMKKKRLSRWKHPAALKSVSVTQHSLCLHRYWSHPYNLGANAPTYYCGYWLFNKLDVLPSCRKGSASRVSERILKFGQTKGRKAGWLDDEQMDAWREGESYSGINWWREWRIENTISKHKNIDVTYYVVSYSPGPKKLLQLNQISYFCSFLWS